MAVKVISVSFQLLILSTVLQYVCSDKVVKCLGKHEQHRICGPPCPPTCYDLIEKSACRKEDVCVKGCFCKQGFYRNDEKQCVLPEDCFPEDKTKCKTPDLETYDDECGNCQTTCENYGKEMFCPDPCKAGCICNDGLVRNEEGNCIPPKFCKKMLEDPLPCGTSLEDFHYCKAACERTCQNYGDDLNCSQECKAGCVCKEGLVRGDDGLCIMPKYCTNLGLPEDYCLGYHEEYMCGSPCDTKCSTLGQPCKKFSYQCVKKCFCEKGYARDHRNLCIPIKKCPKSTTALESFLNFIRSGKNRVTRLRRMVRRPVKK